MRRVSSVARAKDRFVRFRGLLNELLGRPPVGHILPVAHFGSDGIIQVQAVETGGVRTSGEPSPSDRALVRRQSMHMLSGKGWRPGYCPYFRHDGQVRVKVSAWISLAEIADAYLVQGRRIGRVLSYIRMYGLMPTITKVVSRLSEAERNSKCIALGWGRVAETCPESSLAAEQAVVFLAPFHPPCVDEVCLHHGLMRPLQALPDATDSPDGVYHGSRVDGPSDDLDDLAGWMEWSGTPLDDALVARLLDKYEPLLFDAQVTGTLKKLTLDVAPKASAARTRADRPPVAHRKRAVIFGLGQYAKVGVVPRVKRYLDVVCLHELDPAQLGPVSKYRCDVRTSMHPEPDEKYDVFLIASYHHTHASLAISGLKQGAAVVSEKPLVTTSDQLDSLLDTLKQTDGTFFAGYQRRYGPLNAYLREDLLIGPETPVSVRAIVYEIPVPKKHWYQWPNSGSRIISNACHWIDHFLFLNEYVSPTRIDAAQQANGDVLVAIDLKNGASFCMTITEWGSARLGMRDVVHFTVDDRAATITDSTHYVAESTDKILRRARAKRIVGFDDMYRTISRKIATDQPGDTLQSIEVSTRAVLAAEEAFQRSIAK